MDKVMRVFDSGATRNTDEGKIDYYGLMSPRVLKCYAEYMNKHRLQADGLLRDSDNWKLGIPVKQYMKSLLRHTMDLWYEYEAAVIEDASAVNKELLCAVIFNAMGMLYETIISEENITEEDDYIPPIEVFTADKATEPPLTASGMTTSANPLMKLFGWGKKT